MSILNKLRHKLLRREHDRDEHLAKYKKDRRAVRYLRSLIRKVSRRSEPTRMYDSVDLSQIPSDAPAAAGYVGGSWPTFKELKKKFPRARRLSIAVNASEDADALDIESGDATPDQAPDWVRRQQKRGVKRPVVYASASVMPSVLAALKAAGIKREEVRVWTAHYTFTPHLCGPHSCGFLTDTVADATQFTDTAHGRNLDESLLDKGFFS
ncbi:MAG: hypothetical protein JSS68_14955 [Actinobacteria bacterium]|nr:hypothetical protein [Actinomycetota bacterium]